MSRIAWRNPARRLLGEIRYAGMRWHVQGGELYLSGATDRLTDVQRALIDRHRSALVAILRDLPSDCVVPHMCCVVGQCGPQLCCQARSMGSEEAA